MATLLFNDFIVGPTTVPIQTHFPSARRQIAMTVAADITGWTFTATYRNLVLDAVAFDRSGTPNFTSSTVIGYFPEVTVGGGDVPVIVNGTAGTMNIFIPADMYTGGLLSGSRTKPVVSVYNLHMTDTSSNITVMRYPQFIAYESSMAVSDPTLEVGYVAVV